MHLQNHTSNSHLVYTRTFNMQTVFIYHVIILHLPICSSPHMYGQRKHELFMLNQLAVSVIIPPLHNGCEVIHFQNDCMLRNGQKQHQSSSSAKMHS